MSKGDRIKRERAGGEERSATIAVLTGFLVFLYACVAPQQQPETKAATVFSEVPAWPGANPDIHRIEIGKALLGPIGQLGEYTGDCWTISFTPIAPRGATYENGLLEVELNQIGWLRVNGIESGPALHHSFSVPSIDSASARRMGGQWIKWK